MTDKEWNRLLRSLPRGLSYLEAADRLGLHYQQVRNAIKRLGYRAIDGRRFSQNHRRKIRAEDVDWSMSNIAIARLFGVSKERVRAIRDRLGKPFVESRGRKKIR